MNNIIAYIEKSFSLVLTPCTVPLNSKHVFKRDFYLLISDKLGFRFMRFLRAISPIKYMSERPGGEIWMKHKESGIEVQIKPIPPEASIYGDNDGIFQPMLSGNYKVRVYTNDVPDKNSFKINSISYSQSINHYFMKIPILKEEYRNNRLKEVIRED